MSISFFDGRVSVISITTIQKTPHNVHVIDFFAVLHDSHWCLIVYIHRFCGQLFIYFVHTCDSGLHLSHLSFFEALLLL